MYCFGAVVAVPRALRQISERRFGKRGLHADPLFGYRERLFWSVSGISHEYGCEDEKEKIQTRSLEEGKTKVDELAKDLECPRGIAIDGRRVYSVSNKGGLEAGTDFGTGSLSS
jgi:hypothetical protein